MTRSSSGLVNETWDPKQDPFLNPPQTFAHETSLLLTSALLGHFSFGRQLFPNLSYSISLIDPRITAPSNYRCPFLFGEMPTTDLCPSPQFLHGTAAFFQTFSLTPPFFFFLLSPLLPPAKLRLFPATFRDLFDFTIQNVGPSKTKFGTPLESSRQAETTSLISRFFPSCLILLDSVHGSVFSPFLPLSGDFRRRA